MDEATFYECYREGADDHGAYCQLKLTCGHWSNRLSVASSVFDFPADPLRCNECGEERQMDLRLQVELYRTA